MLVEALGDTAIKVLLMKPGEKACFPDATPPGNTALKRETCGSATTRRRTQSARSRQSAITTRHRRDVLSAASAATDAWRSAIAAAIVGSIPASRTVTAAAHFPRPRRRPCSTTRCQK